MDFDKDNIKKTTNNVVSTVFDSIDVRSDSKDDYMTKGKSRHFWTWILAMIVLTLLIGSVGGYLIIKKSNDKIASSYKSKVISYLYDVHDTASSSTSDPSEVGYEVSKIKFPELVKVYFDGFSPEYDKAKTIETDTKEAISVLRSKIADSVGVYNFYNQWKNIENRLIQIGNTSAPKPSTYEEFRATLSQFISLIDETVMPNELVYYKSDLRSSTQKLYDSWNILLDAYNAESQVGYSAAFSEYEKSTKLVENSIEPFQDYYDNLSSKVKSYADDIKAYAETLK